MNDERRERQAEAGYLSALRRDFEQTRANFVEALEGNRMVRDNNLAFLEVLAGPPESVSVDSLRTLNEFAFWVWFYRPVLGTYHDLLSSGSLPIVRSDSLRLAMAQFETDFEGLDRIVMEGWEQYNLMQAPYVIDRLNFRDFYGGEYRGVATPRSAHPTDLSAYWSREFSNVLTMTVMSRQDMVVNGEEALRSVEQILDLIGRAEAALH